MRAELINPFLAASKNVLETMCQLPTTPGKPYIKGDKSSYGEITGVIGMISETIHGSMLVSFSKKCILQIVANMLMEPIKDSIDADVADAVGELTNMISGGAKAQLSKLNHSFELTTPTMIAGRGVTISFYSEDPTIVIPFSTSAGDFVVEANLSEKS